MKIITLVFMLLVVGCGQDQVDITYHVMSLQELKIKFGHPVLGHAWRKRAYPETWKWNCNIWIAPLNEYSSKQCFIDVIEHEKQHCYTGSYHTDNVTIASCNSDEFDKRNISD